MNWFINNPQIIVVLLVVGGSVLQWLLKTIAEQKASRQRRAEMEQRELEALRTGREPAAPMGVPAEFSREDELAELRRRAKARAEQSGRQESADVGLPSPQSPTAQPNPLEILLGLPPGSTSGGTVPPRSGRARDIAAERRKRQKTRPMPQSAPPQQPDQSDRFSNEARNARIKAREQQKQAERARREQAEREARAAQAQQARATQAKLAADKQHAQATAPKAARPAIGINPVPTSREGWRRALIANEILNKPFALRTDADRGIF